MNIVILEGYTTNPGDLSWDRLTEFGKLTVYDRTSPNQVLERARNAEVLIINGLELTADMIAGLPDLSMISLLATGYNNVDLDAARARGIAVCNTPNYSTEAVAQHTMALLLEITNHVGLHSASVHNGDWQQCQDDCYCIKPLTLVHGKTLGIVGYGKIGKQVGKIAAALGMNVISYRENPVEAQSADVVSLHCPLTPETRGFVNKDFISGMKDGAILLNTARGNLVVEPDLLAALQTGKLSAAGIDVLQTEPPTNSEKSPLLGAPNCFITPHHAWMPQETRSLLIQIAADNISSFLAGGRRNRVD